MGEFRREIGVDLGREAKGSEFDSATQDGECMDRLTGGLLHLRPRLLAGSPSAESFPAEFGIRLSTRTGSKGSMMKSGSVPTVELNQASRVWSSGSFAPPLMAVPDCTSRETRDVCFPGCSSGPDSALNEPGLGSPESGLRSREAAPFPRKRGVLGEGDAHSRRCPRS